MSGWGSQASLQNIIWPASVEMAVRTPLQAEQHGVGWMAIWEEGDGERGKGKRKWACRGARRQTPAQGGEGWAVQGGRGATMACTGMMRWAGPEPRKALKRSLTREIHQECTRRDVISPNLCFPIFTSRTAVYFPPESHHYQHTKA